jgi:hypothetical protein
LAAEEVISEVAAEELSIEVKLAAAGCTEIWLLAVVVSVAEGAEKVAEVGCGRALVVVVITESVAQVALEEGSTPGAATEVGLVARL